jgi:ATP-dependent Clp protease ATP-binding subunit ClpB
MEKHSVSRMIGAPPGYIGYDEGGQLTEAVRRKPYSVVLLDEIEKAHLDVFNVLLQILDDGRITDSQGRTVNFKNTVLIMTSNIGSSRLLEGINDNGEIPDSVRDAVLDELKRYFRPEFLNRVDDTVLFKTLMKNELEKIVQLSLEDLSKRLLSRGIRLEVSDSAVSYLANHGYDPVYGARPLKRLIQHELETSIGRQIIADKVSDGSVLKVDVEKDKLKVRVG